MQCLLSRFFNLLRRKRRKWQYIYNETKWRRAGTTMMRVGIELTTFTHSLHWKWLENYLLLVTVTYHNMARAGKPVNSSFFRDLLSFLSFLTQIWRLFPVLKTRSTVGKLELVNSLPKWRKRCSLHKLYKNSLN